MEIILIIAVCVFVIVSAAVAIFLWRKHKIIKTVLDFDSRDVKNLFSK